MAPAQLLISLDYIADSSQRLPYVYISKNNKFPITIPPEECFPFLFAWEFFDITYDCIKTTDMFKKNYYLAKLWDKVKESK